MTDEGDEPPLAETPEPAWYCLSCGTENVLAARICRQCGRALSLSARQQREGLAFLLNELEALHDEAAIPTDLYASLRERYRTLLGVRETLVARPTAARPASRPAGAPPPTRPPEPRPAAAPRPPVPRREGPGWLAEQQANLLLYVGAFLIVIATLIFVSASGEAVSGGVRMALLLLGTLLFLSAGYACLRYPRVQQAGVVFFAVGALMAPLNFVGMYAFFFADDDIDPTGLWIAGSLVSALFYGAVSLTRLGRWYSVPAIIALGSALGAVLVALEAPAEAYPGSYIALAFVVAAPSLLPLGRVSEIFGEIGLYAANAAVPVAAIAAFAMLGASEDNASESLFELQTRWYLAPTYALAALFYGALAMARFERWFAAPTVIALGGTLGGFLYALDVPPEVYPGSFIALAFVAAAPSLLPLGRVSDVFGETGLCVANAAVPPAAIAALAIAGVRTDGDAALDIATRWYLPPTGAIAALFYWAQAISPRRLWPELEPYWGAAALAVTGGALVTITYALDVGQQWYGPTVAIVGGLYASASVGFGMKGEWPSWTGQRFLGWLALGAITVAWLCFEGVFSEFPRHGAGVHFAATLFYAAAAARAGGRMPVFERLDARGAMTGEHYEVPAGVPFVYAAGLTLGIGYYHLLSSLPAADTAGASDLSLAFFWLSLGVAAVGVLLRWVLPHLRWHVYGVALAMSLFVLLAAVEAEGRVAALLVTYATVALALALWERFALALPLAAAYGFFALLAAWGHYDTDVAYLPLTLSGIGFVLFAAGAVLGQRAASTRDELLDYLRDWTLTLVALAFAYAVLAPIVGWVWLANLADPEGFVGGQPFEQTLLYQTCAASVMLLGVLAAVQAWLMRRWELAAGASALFMVALLLQIGHWRPDNVQAYTAPLGAYLLAGALLALRLRDLPADLRMFIGPLEAVGAALIMAPSFEQSLTDGAWQYAVLLLGESLAFIALALVQRRLWLLATAVGFVVLNAFHYLFFAGAPPLPAEALLAIAGVAVMLAGTAILLSRERWTEWQQAVVSWWNREPPLPAAK